VLAALVGLAIADRADAGALRRYEKAAAEGKIRKLTHGVGHRHSYVRALAAQALASQPPSEAATRKLLLCVPDPRERDWVRSACASTLASWQVADAVPIIASTLGDVGAEARYWMADALHRLGGTEARAALAGLASDPDLFVSTAAREWSR
jgi:HEAT repeat protein